MNPEDKLIVALDVETAKKAEKVVKELFPAVKFFKVGSQLFTAAGPKIVEKIHEIGGQVFLDLKIYDIPHTVAKVAEVITEMGVFMFNVHASGGEDMMWEAVTAADARARATGKVRPIILGVTVLTSFTEEMLQRALNIEHPLNELVGHLAHLAQQAGLDGVVASAHEVALIRKWCGKDFVIVTPGIRPAAEAANDQKRVMTPAEAIAAGSDYLVVGRPILAAKSPRAAAEKILEEIRTAS